MVGLVALASREEIFGLAAVLAATVAVYWLSARRQPGRPDPETP
jgi:hypothetical protein